MNCNKIEKRLPDEIIDLIDLEVSSKGMSRQEIISHLVRAVKGADQSEENKRLKREIELLQKQRDEEKKEIHFLRDEISKFSSGLTSLAVTIGENKGNFEHESVIASLSDQVEVLSQEMVLLKRDPHIESNTAIEKNLPLIMVSILAALLLIYLIISKVIS
ncbi:MAG TPA: hypothetical protein VN372_01045 [Methanospirillum sp.]|nr:hypothetical protein [Methanospirillum sp.]